MSKRRNRPKLTTALETVERAVGEAAGSKQPRFAGVSSQALFQSLYKWAKNELQIEPRYQTDSRARDRWLSNIWRSEPHIAGVLASVVSINANRGWWISGGRNQVNRYNAILRGVEDGAGWRQYFSQASQSFYTSDIGSITEIGRDGGPDGPMRDLYFVDSARCYLTGKRNIPLAYAPSNGMTEQGWMANDYFRVSSMPSTNEALRGLGFCALSRAIQLVQLMMAVYEHDKEMLGAKAPKGLLLLNNISESQWLNAMTARAANLTSMEREYYGGVAVLAQEGVDKVDAKLLALSQLPAGFDIKVSTDLLMYGLALVFEQDPNEFWPVSGAVLGRGAEAQLQHAKATGKGSLSFVLSWQDKFQQELPDTLEMEFEQRDIQGELIEANVQKAWADVADVLYQKGVGPLTTDETRIWLAERGVIPTEWTLAKDEITAESSGEISGEQRSISRMVNRSSMWAAAFASPFEPLIRANHLGEVEYISSTGLEWIRKYKKHPMARSMAAEYGWYNPTVVRDVFGHSFGVKQLTVSRAAKILFENDEVTITQEDVDKAINEGADRIGAEYKDLVSAK